MLFGLQVCVCVCIVGVGFTLLLAFAGGGTLGAYSPLVRFLQEEGLKNYKCMFAFFLHFSILYFPHFFALPHFLEEFEFLFFSDFPPIF